MVRKEKCLKCKKDVEVKEVINLPDHDEIVLICGHKYRHFTRNLRDYAPASDSWAMCDNTYDSLYFLDKLKDTLKTRFEQQEIMMYSTTVNIF